MGLKRPVSDEETSPVKLRKDAEAAVSMLSPFSSPGQFKRKLSKYSKVVSPNVIGYASDVIVSMADKPTKSVYQALEQTLNNIKILLDWRVVKKLNDKLEEDLKESNKVHALNRACRMNDRAAQARAEKRQQLRESIASRPIRGRQLLFGPPREMRPVPRP